MYAYMHAHEERFRGQKVSNAPEVGGTGSCKHTQAHTAVNCLIWVLGTELEPSTAAVCALSH